MKEISKKVVVGTLAFPIKIQITKHDIPEQFRNFQYIITHKVITTKRPLSIISNVKKEFQNKFYVIIDSAEIVGKKFNLQRLRSKIRHSKKSKKQLRRMY